jgi:hypothetical protein
MIGQEMHLISNTLQNTYSPTPAYNLIIPRTPAITTLFVTPYIGNTTLLYLAAKIDSLRKYASSTGTGCLLYTKHTNARRGDDATRSFLLLEDAADGAIAVNMPNCLPHKVRHRKHSQLREAFVFRQQDGVCHNNFLKDASRKPFNRGRAEKSTMLIHKSSEGISMSEYKGSNLFKPNKASCYFLK